VKHRWKWSTVGAAEMPLAYRCKKTCLFNCGTGTKFVAILGVFSMKIKIVRQKMIIPTNKESYRNCNICPKYLFTTLYSLSLKGSKHFVVRFCKCGSSVRFTEVWMKIWRWWKAHVLHIAEYILSMFCIGVILFCSFSDAITSTLRIDVIFNILLPLIMLRPLPWIHESRWEFCP